MNISITPEQIDSLVTDAILKAGLGKAIDKAVQDTLNSGYKNPIEDSIKAFIVRTAADIVQTVYADKIKAAVVSYLEKIVTDELITTITETVVTKMERAASDRY